MYKFGLFSGFTLNGFYEEQKSEHKTFLIVEQKFYFLYKVVQFRSSITLVIAAIKICQFYFVNFRLIYFKGFLIWFYSSCRYLIQVTTTVAWLLSPLRSKSTEVRCQAMPFIKVSCSDVFKLCIQRRRWRLASDQWGTAASTFVYFTQLSPSGGAFFGWNGRETKLAWMAGQKISSKETSRGTKCVK